MTKITPVPNIPQLKKDFKRFTQSNGRYFTKLLLKEQEDSIKPKTNRDKHETDNSST